MILNALQVVAASCKALVVMGKTMLDCVEIKKEWYEELRTLFHDYTATKIMDAFITYSFTGDEPSSFSRDELFAFKWIVAESKL